MCSKMEDSFKDSFKDLCHEFGLLNNNIKFILVGFIIYAVADLANYSLRLYDAEQNAKNNETENSDLIKELTRKRALAEVKVKLGTSISGGLLVILMGVSIFAKGKSLCSSNGVTDQLKSVAHEQTKE